jgi:hypothetical protein
MGGASGACGELQACCGRLGAQMQGCELLFNQAHGDAMTCASDYQLFCPQHTCADLLACCASLSGSAKATCDQQVAQVAGNDATCSVLYIRLCP